MTTNTPASIIIDGITYLPQRQSADRAVIVVDRGWIFAGDVFEDMGRIFLSNAVWLFRWTGCGFAAVIEDPTKADIRPIADLDIPAGSEIFRISVAAGWGLK